MPYCYVDIGDVFDNDKALDSYFQTIKDEIENPNFNLNNLGSNGHFIDLLLSEIKQSEASNPEKVRNFLKILDAYHMESIGTASYYLNDVLLSTVNLHLLSMVTP